MSNSNSMNDDFMDFLVAAIFATVAVGVVLYVVDEMTIKSLEPTVNDDDTAIFRHKIESPNANQLVSTQNEWKQDFYLYLNNYIEKETDGLLVLKEVTITSGSMDLTELYEPTKKLFALMDDGGKSAQSIIKAITDGLDLAERIIAYFNPGKTPQKQAEA